MIDPKKNHPNNSDNTGKPDQDIEKEGCNAGAVEPITPRPDLRSTISLGEDPSDLVTFDKKK